MIKKYLKQYWPALLIVGILLFLLYNNGSLEYFGIYAPILNDDARHPSLIDEHDYYKYDLEQLKDKRKCIGSLKCAENPVFLPHPDPIKDMEDVMFRKDDPPHLVSPNYSVSSMNSCVKTYRRPLPPQPALSPPTKEIRHTRECTADECYCD